VIAVIALLHDRRANPSILILQQLAHGIEGLRLRAVVHDLTQQGANMSRLATSPEAPDHRIHDRGSTLRVLAQTKVERLTAATNLPR
jgi:hypothetical protein